MVVENVTARGGVPETKDIYNTVPVMLNYFNKCAPRAIYPHHYYPELFVCVHGEDESFEANHAM